MDDLSRVLGHWAPCSYCEGGGVVVDNRREETIDCPSCDGMGMIYFADYDPDDYEPEGDDDE